MKFEIRKIQDLELRGKRVFVRVDFNVPLEPNGDGWKVSDSKRIEGALPTIQHIIEAGGKCILASHLGRPKAQIVAKYSLEPVGAKLSELLKKDVVLTDDCIGDGPRGLSAQMRNGDVLLLENLRFHAGEEENSPDFVARLAEMTDVYIGDAFGTVHRAHASTAGLPKLIANRAAGFLVQKELEFLAPLRDNPQRPFAIVTGGSKVSDKMGVLEHFLPKVDKIFVGGAMAYAFLRARGVEIGKSLCDDKQVQLASKLLRAAEARKVKVILPVDHLVTPAFDNVAEAKLTETESIPAGRMGVDVGPKTLALFAKELEKVETLFWNGPMGVFEVPAFSKGTFELARLISETSAKKLVGGGDSASAISQAGYEDKFDFISTGGGATLEFLEGQELPGIKALEIEIPGS